MIFWWLRRQWRRWQKSEEQPFFMVIAACGGFVGGAGLLAFAAEGDISMHVAAALSTAYLSACVVLFGSRVSAAMRAYFDRIRTEYESDTRPQDTINDDTDDQETTRRR